MEKYFNMKNKYSNGYNDDPYGPIKPQKVKFIQKFNSAAQAIENKEKQQRANRKFISNFSTNNPVVVVPNPAMESLDNKPRVDILEDVMFNKAIPKSIKYYKPGTLTGNNNKLVYVKS